MRSIAIRTRLTTLRVRFREGGVIGRKLVSLFVSLVMLTSVGAAPAVADDSSTREYSVLYHGNFSDADAHRFSYRLYYFGGNHTWTGVTQWSYAANERDVNHWDFTNGWPGVDPWQGANKADLLYASGHGGSNGMAIFDPSSMNDPDREEDQNGIPDNIGPTKYLNIEGSGEIINWWVGTDATGTNRTDSRWDDDIEWVFLAACKQLATSYNSRRNYARTLLGDPHRAHAIWSYNGLAPNDGPDTEIVNEFFDYNAQGLSNRYSWLKANDNHGALGCGIVHASVQYEGLPPVNPIDPDSPVGSTPDIHYWYVDGGHKYSQQPVSYWDKSTEWLDQIASRIFGLETAYAEAPDDVVGSDTIYHLRTELPALRDTPVLQVGDSAAAIGFDSATELLGGPLEPAVLSPDAAVEFRRGARGTISTWPTGAQAVLFCGESRNPAGVSESEAIERAKRFIEGIEGMPHDASVVEVRTFASCPLDVEDGSLGKETVSEYIVDFGRFYDGIEIDGPDGDKLSVVLDSEGVREYRRNWRSIVGPERNGPRARISATEALRVLANEGETHFDMPDEVEITGVDLVYYSAGPSKSQSAMFPTWRITLDDSDCFYVNAVTGRAMNE